MPTILEVEEGRDSRYAGLNCRSQHSEQAASSDRQVTSITDLLVPCRHICGPGQRSIGVASRRDGAGRPFAGTIHHAASAYTLTKQPAGPNSPTSVGFSPTNPTESSQSHIKFIASELGRTSLTEYSLEATLGPTFLV
jgi:hypothetical protein